MATLQPILNQGATYEKPVEAPSLIGSLAGVLGDVGGSFVGTQTKPRTPTADERFASDWGAFANEVGAPLNPNNPNYSKNLRKYGRTFLSKNPQHSGSFKTFASGQGVEELTPMDERVTSAQEEKQIAWMSSPEYMVEFQKASTIYDTEEEIDAHMSGKYSEHLRTKAALTKITDAAAIGTARQTVSSNYWQAYRGKATDKAQSYTRAFFDIAQNVRENGSVETPPELREALGLPEKITKDNLYGIAVRFRGNIEKELLTSLKSSEGVDPNKVLPPPKQYLDGILVGYDAAIKSIEKDFGSAEDIAKFVSDTTNQKAMEKLQKTSPELYSGLTFINLFPKELSGIVWTALQNSPDINMDEEVSEALSKFVLISSSGVATPEELGDEVGKGSKKEAQTFLKASAESMKAGLEGDHLRNATTLFFKSKERAGETGALSYSAFKNTIGKNVAGLKREADLNEDFATDLKQNLLNDMVLSYNLVEKSGARFKDIVKLGVSPEGKVTAYVDRNAIDPEEFADVEAVVDDLLATALESKEALDFQDKINTVLKLGEHGKEIVDSLSQQFPSEIVYGGEGSEPTPTTTGGDTTAGSDGGDTLGVGNGPIAQNLGIDFAGYEEANGLPSGYLERVAYIESKGNPSAKNPDSSAGGLFQQIDSNAKAYGVVDRFDATQSTEGAVKFAVDNVKILEKALGRRPQGWELYLAHQQGGTGAAKLLSNPSAKAADIVGADAVRLNGGHENMTAGEFAKIWATKYSGGRGPVNYSQATGKPNENVRPNLRPESLGDFSEAAQTVNTMSAQQAVTTPQETAEATQVSDVREGTQEKLKGAKKTADEVTDILSLKTKEVLDSLGVDPKDVPVYENGEEVSKAFRDGKLTTGDVIIVGGQLIQL